MAQTADSRQEQDKRLAVYRLVEVTDTLAERCSLVSPDVATKYKFALSRFVLAYPKLMMLVKQSPHFESARKRQKERQSSGALGSGECEYLIDLISGMIDIQEARASVRDIEKLLSQDVP